MSMMAGGFGNTSGMTTKCLVGGLQYRGLGRSMGVPLQVLLGSTGQTGGQHGGGDLKSSIFKPPSVQQTDILGCADVEICLL